MSSVKKVAILSRYLPHYRKPFIEGLYYDLKDSNIDFLYIYGNPDPNESRKNDSVDFENGKRIKNWYFQIKGKYFCWQPCFFGLLKSDLVIVAQANKNLINYPLILMAKLGVIKLAFWGHGKNFQDHISSRANRFKKRLINSVNWWFAYTFLTRDYLLDCGFDKEKITLVKNAIDTTPIIDLENKLSSSNQSSIDGLGVKINNQTCVFIGGLYEYKRIDFLLESSLEIHNTLPDFNLIVIGDGVERQKVIDFAENHSFVTYLGALYDDQKNEILIKSRLLLMPGLVGLVILDSFAAKTPLITTNYPYHSPEIDYLENGENGVLTSNYNDLREYSNAVMNALTNEGIYDSLVTGCENSRQEYSLTNMIKNFKDGIQKATNG